MSLIDVAKTELLTIDFFSNIGNSKIAVFGFRCERVESINGAIKKITGSKWDKTQTERIGDISAYLAKNHQEADRLWNNIVDETKDKILPTVLHKLESSTFEPDTLSVILPSIKYDVVNLSLALVYQRYYQSEFFLRMLDIYKAGHIPCGWHGKPGKGHFLVY